MTATLKLQSMSYFKGSVQEEKTDFAQTYSTDGVTVKNTTISYYENNVRATNAGGETQTTAQWNRSGYARNVIESVDVVVQ